ncbi:tetratricopeptide repeat protein [Frankia sp. CNm7]|uniref:Tetratricopeptide repeat protein n=1 Tax=Frankia nepalensis TaxID=1836974 RepID=A0A937RLI1_9ACTN|nr:FxSxx-COOH system tetratricopeptide repeat protein [Frankia nepalensis]MBL7501698.1 tetratricopeptide repeat protein [Frankia nepalensis]MBL7513457.1 tetratricopeptide repeat protein [Frankia nepalensis]MBL7520846.1 tetratricopeptide repeat protein [Frankia nepalensis]MBL7632547.1 tetratricopeptide repeat protein [Frankia nepalensis]
MDFFVSHAGPDTEWAEWVAATLASAGYGVELDVWDWTAGTSFVAAMNRALTRAGRVLALVSPAYFARTWTTAEWEAAFVRRAEDSGFLVPVLIRRCAPEEYPRLLTPLIHIDLVGLNEAAARKMLVDRLAGPARPPAGATVPFPGSERGALAPRGSGGRPLVFPGRLPDVWGPVPARNLFFTGRDQALADLHARLAGDAEPVVTVSALAGMGGVGKTQLAAEYAHRHASAYRLVWWINAETANQAATGLGTLADTLGLPPGDPAQRRAMLWAALAGRDDWLLVYDNITDPDTLAAVLPPRVSGRVLVTSRARLPRLPTVDIGIFDRAESVALLHYHLSELSTADADRVASALTDLPLAVDQAGAYLAETPLGVDAYLRLLADQPQLALADATPDHAGLAATVTAARARLAALDPDAAGLLDQLAFLASDPIPLAGAGPTSTGLVVAGDRGKAAERLRLLVRLALTRRTGTGVQLHRLVAALLRARLDPDERAATLGRCLHLLVSANPGDPEDPATWLAWAAIAPHIQAASAHLATIGPPAPAEPEPFRALLADCAWYLYRNGQADSVRQLATALGRWTRGRPGPDDLHTLRVATALASALSFLGEVQEARNLAADTLTRCRRVLGEDSPVTLYSAVYLAGDLVVLGEMEEARELAADTLVRCRRILGPDRPATLDLAATLANALLAGGEVQEARELAADTLARCRRVFGEEPPVTLYSRATLSGAMMMLGEAAAARELAADTLVRCRQLLGPDDPMALLSAVALAGALLLLGEAQAARELAADTLARCRRVFGEDHLLTRYSGTALTGAMTMLESDA